MDLLAAMNCIVDEVKGQLGREQRNISMRLEDKMFRVSYRCPQEEVAAVVAHCLLARKRHSLKLEIEIEMFKTSPHAKDGMLVVIRGLN